MDKIKLSQEKDFDGLAREIIESIALLDADNYERVIVQALREWFEPPEL